MDNEIMVQQNSVTSLIDSVDIGAIAGTMQKINTFQKGGTYGLSAPLL